MDVKKLLSPDTQLKRLGKKISWNKTIEHNIKKIGEKALGYKIMHIKESLNISKKYNFLMYMGIFFGPLSGLLSATGAIVTPVDAPVYFPMMASCVAFLSGIVVAITKFGKFEVRCTHHKTAASKYISLENNIRRQLALCRWDRVHAQRYLEWVGKSFDNLFRESPLIAARIYSKYIEMAKKAGLIVPEEYHIEINTDDESKTRTFNDVSTIRINIEDNEDKENRKSISDHSNNSNNSNKANLRDKNRTSISNNSLKNKNKKSVSHTNLFSESSKYNDGMMNYEMNRMMDLV